MITCRKIKTFGEIEKLEEILRYYDIKDTNRGNSIIYVMEEDDRIIGGSSILVYNDIGIFKYLVIDNYMTGSDLGDGLLRSILNYCNLKGIKKVFYPIVDLYLLKKKFAYNTLNKNDSRLLNEVENSYKLVCFVEDFFNNTCKHKRIEVNV